MEEINHMKKMNREVANIENQDVIERQEIPKSQDVIERPNVLESIK